MTLPTTTEYWNAIVFGGTYHPEVCARCDLKNTHLCTRTGCEMTALEAVANLNGGKMPDPPKVRNDHLTDCGIPVESHAADVAQLWAERHGG